MDHIDLGTFGLTVTPAAPGAEEIEALGFGALWVNGGQLDRLERLTDLLATTGRAAVAPAIIPPDVYGADAVVDLFRRAEVAAPGRLMIGLGSPSQPRPRAALGAYVDELGAIPRESRLLAAFGPRMLDTARDRFGGAMPGMVTPEYTAIARERLGPDRLLVVGMYAVVDTDADAARETARVPLRFLMGMRSYVNSALRQGFSETDIATVSDDLVDRLVAWGSADDIAKQARRHREAGADHVYLSALHNDTQPSGVAAARLLAPVLFG